MWVLLTVANFKLRFSEDESDAVLTEQGGDTAITEYLRQVAGEIVANVNQCRRSRGLAFITPPALYVPPGSERHAYTLAQSLQATSQGRPLGALQGDVRGSALDKAEDHLKALAACEMDADDEWAEAYESASGTVVPQFGGMAKMDFIGGSGINEPRIPEEAEAT